MDVKLIFNTFLIEEFLNLNLDELISYCYSVKNRDQGRKISNHGGWQSNDINLNDRPIVPLVEQIMLRVNAIKDDFTIKNQFFMSNMWININKSKDYNVSHRHPYSFISGTFYLKVNKDSGNIVFVNPNLLHEYYYGHLQIEKHNHITSTTWPIKPENNKLVLFSSSLEHYVESNNSDEDRISISFNTNYYI